MVEFNLPCGKSPKFILDIYFLTLLINVAGQQSQQQEQKKVKTENKQENYIEKSRNLLTKSETATNWRCRLREGKALTAHQAIVIKELIPFQQSGRHVFGLN